ncbi:MAG: AAA family ATPase [Gammaproteobacteria bacterium]|nr:AAA family ATPase [Gammaproteobacteria bacterium]
MGDKAVLPAALREGWVSSYSLKEDKSRNLWRFDYILELAVERGIDIWMRPLPFLEHGWLVQGRAVKNLQGFGFALWASRGFSELDTTAVPIYEALDRETLQFDAESVFVYTALFCRFVYSDDGPFWIITDPTDLNASMMPGERATASMPTLPASYDELTLEQLATLIEVPEVTQHRDDWRVKVCVQHGGDLSRAEFLVTADGAIEMAEDTPLVNGIGFVAKRNQKLKAMNFGRVPIQGIESLVELRRGRVATKADMDELMKVINSADVPPDHSPNERTRERSLIRECLRLQLLRSLRRGDAAPLFDAEADLDDDALLLKFAEFLMRSWPAVVIESPYPLAEQTTSLILIDLLDEKPKHNLMQSSVPGEPDLMGIPQVDDGDLLALSFHTARKLVRPEAIAYHLGATESLTMIGCNFLTDLPPALQRMADIVLTLGNLDPELFRQLFCLAFDCEWPTGVDIDDALWVRYVEPHDLERPLRDKQDRTAGWRAEDALQAIRERVERRLDSINTADAPELDDLHGLDAAKAVIRDLIDDLRGAVAGELEWEEVDRGLLLVGEPGTGKTMLARAAAKAAGVHFISTSAGRWAAAATEFYDVIRTIRDVFADAQRYAPSILFLDELDSLGRRDQMTDRNRQLELEELNTVLQELQGFRDRKGVFVIGATNHLDRIDPALTRPGRLDQVVRIPRPNRAALAAILRYHLEPYVAEERVSRDLNLDDLAALAVGCTGADIEAFVRDAARRARKADSLINADHLAAAITRAPRDINTAQPMSVDEQERTAFHEAGHAVACLLAQHYPAELTMVSIVPRSDGSLGFAGFYSDELLGLTRAAHLEYLEILLAGRAAEELRYGVDGVSSGAGGESPTSDLALATRHLLKVVTEFGVHGERSLRWREIHERTTDVAVIGELLDNAYERVRQRLKDHRPLLDMIARRLLDDSEVLADDLEVLARQHGIDAVPADKQVSQV